MNDNICLFYNSFYTSEDEISYRLDPPTFVNGSSTGILRALILVMFRLINQPFADQPIVSEGLSRKLNNTSPSVLPIFRIEIENPAISRDVIKDAT